MKPLFLLDPSITFLNHGSYGAVPRPVFEDWQRWQAEVEHNPVRFLARSSAQWLRQAREGLATDLAYGACLATLRRVCEAQGAHLRVVKVALPLTHEGFAGAMIEAMGSATRVVFMSCITSPTALILPIEPVLEEARRRGILSLIDGAHAPGQIDLNLNALGADFDTGNCHKWLCAPKGTAFFSGACRAPRDAACQRDELGLCGTRGSVELGRLHRFGPVRAAHAMARHTRPERLLGRARRHRIPAGARLAAQRERCHSMAIDLLHRVAQRTGLAPIAPDENLGQMAPLAITHQPAAALRERLFEQFKIEVPVTQHEGRSFVRVSVQAYDSEADLQRLEQSMQALGLFNRWCCVAKPLDPGWEGRFA